MTLEEVEKKIGKVYSLNTKEEREAFYKYAAKVPDDGIILDIGTCAGSSAFIFGWASSPKVKVHTIDPVVNHNFISNLEAFGLGEKIIYHQETSEEVAEKWDLPISLMFIDGIHSYHGVSNDFGWFKQFMVKDGIVMFHDYYLYSNAIGRAIDEIEARGEIEKVEVIDSLYCNEVRTGLYIARIKK
jgi:predicted O-methyltransferase YrrM